MKSQNRGPAYETNQQISDQSDDECQYINKEIIAQSSINLHSNSSSKTPYNEDLKHALKANYRGSYRNNTQTQNQSIDEKLSYSNIYNKEKILSNEVSMKKLRREQSTDSYTVPNIA